jgi:hypothetical protein
LNVPLGVMSHLLNEIVGNNWQEIIPYQEKILHNSGLGVENAKALNLFQSVAFFYAKV